MTITTRNALIDALGNNSSRIVIDKASLSNQVAGRYASLWRSSGQPAQAAIPTTAALCTSALTGAMGFTNQTDPATSYIAWLFAVSSNSATSVEIHDRLAHLGGLVLNTVSPQGVSGLDLATLSVPAARLGSTNYSDVQWWLEVYSDGGSTASNATITATFNDGSSATLSTQAVGGTIRAGMLFPLTPLIQAAQQGKYIKGITNVTLSASTGTAGNFGFTATRPRAILPLPLANKMEVGDWAQVGLPNVPNDSCLSLIMLPSTTSTGTLRGGGKIAHG